MTRSKPKLPIYLDYQATTPVDPRVLDAMLPYFTEKFGNPHSRSHAYGWEAEAAVEHARGQVAHIIGADPKEIVFTSGATEANNMAILGAGRFYGKRRDHVIACVSEHKCVLESCRQLEQEGLEVTYLPVDKSGLISLEDLERAVTERTLLVTIMAVNNEIGVIQPIKEIGEICHRRGAFFHTDAAQAVGKIPLDVNEMNIDLLSISGHKIYGPKGVGALYIRRKPRVRLKPLFSGGGQERGFRSGTLPTPLCVGLGKACEISEEEMSAESERLKRLRDRLLKGIMEQLPEVYLNGDLEHRIPGNLNLSFAYVNGDALLASVKNLSVSSGSACTSASVESSYVLRALGVSDELGHASLRFGIGRFTTEEDIDFAIEEIVKQVKALREKSPLWEMAQERAGAKPVEWAAH
jgi:cysteine desulfurase